ncbi:Xanthosine operon regulatory protein XapR [Klebsiella grimontii]|nr:Xanthosine operon regulatory protein XapR [Klebsiella grimontii]
MERTHRIDLKLLRYFLAVAEELHFGRAAARLNMSQPPLSIHIKDLEQQLGTLLFVRHSRSVALTHAGKILMEESRRLLSSANQALARVEQIGRGEAGRVELGVIGTAMWGKMRPVMRRFLKEHPNVEVLFQREYARDADGDAGTTRAGRRRLANGNGAFSWLLPACACMSPLFWWPCRKSIR